MRKSSFLKKVIAVSLCATVSVSMTACGNNSSSSGSQNDSTPTSSAVENSSAASSDSAQSSPESSAQTSTENTESSTPEETSYPEDTPYTLGGELTPAMIARSRYNEGNKVRLAKVIKKLQANEEVTVAYIGGSITQGTSAGDDLCYARLTTNWLEEKFPNAKINYVNAGVGATGSFYGVSRVDNDVLSHDPDLVFVEFSVNDTTERTETNKETYAALLRKIWAHSTSPAIVTIAMTQENGTSFQEYHGEIVKMFDLPMISYKDVILNIIEKGYIIWDDISNDDIHPNVPGHALLSNLITNYLQSVIDDVDNISGDESNFDVESDLGKKYLNLKFFTSDTIEATKLGAFEVTNATFANFKNPWMLKSKTAQFTDDDALEFEFEGTNLEIMYSRMKKYGIMADIYVDGELVKTLNGDFTGGWGSYIELEQIASGLSEGKHTLKIAPKSQERETNALFYVAGILVS